MARIKNKFNVSIAEVDFNDNHRMAQIGAAVAGNDHAHVDRMISTIVKVIDSEPEMIMTDYRVEIL